MKETVFDDIIIPNLLTCCNRFRYIDESEIINILLLCWKSYGSANGRTNYRVTKHEGGLLMGILSGNPKEEPLHYGEVFDIWASQLVGNSMTAGYQTMLNHAGDGDLKKLLVEAIETCKEEKKQLEELLKENGVGLPPAAPEPPDACLEDIPVGARIPDPAIAATLSADIAAGLVTCSQIIGKSIREDVAAMYSQFHTKKAALGAKVLRLNKEKGWLIPPPLHLNKHGDC